MLPCATRMVPLPSGGGAAYTSGSPSSSSTTAAPQMSTMESTAPTSWKWISSMDTPCTFASASPMARNTASARAFAFAESVSAASMSRWMSE